MKPSDDYSRLYNATKWPMTYALGAAVGGIIHPTVGVIGGIGTAATLGKAFQRGPNGKLSTNFGKAGAFWTGIGAAQMAGLSGGMSVGAGIGAMAMRGLYNTAAGTLSSGSGWGKLAGVGAFGLGAGAVATGVIAGTMAAYDSWDTDRFLESRAEWVGRRLAPGLLTAGAAAVGMAAYGGPRGRAAVGKVFGSKIGLAATLGGSIGASYAGESFFSAAAVGISAAAGGMIASRSKSQFLPGVLKNSPIAATAGAFALAAGVGKIFDFMAEGKRQEMDEFGVVTRRGMSPNFLSAGNMALASHYAHR